jgi:hypothetical protein
MRPSQIPDPWRAKPWATASDSPFVWVSPPTWPYEFKPTRPGFGLVADELGGASERCALAALQSGRGRLGFIVPAKLLEAFVPPPGTEIVPVEASGAVLLGLRSLRHPMLADAAGATSYDKGLEAIARSTRAPSRWDRERRSDPDRIVHHYVQETERGPLPRIEVVLEVTGSPPRLTSADDVLGGSRALLTTRLGRTSLGRELCWFVDPDSFDELLPQWRDWILLYARPPRDLSSDPGPAAV